MMQPYVTTITLDEKREVTIQLPEDMPTGEVRITVEPVAAGTPPEPLTREWMRAKLIAAGLGDEDMSEPDAIEVSENEIKRVGKKFADVRPLSELIDEDREERI